MVTMRFEDDFRFGASGNTKLSLQALKPFEIFSLWALDHFDDYFLSDRQLETLFKAQR